MSSNRLLMRLRAPFPGMIFDRQAGRSASIPGKHLTSDRSEDLDLEAISSYRMSSGSMTEGVMDLMEEAFCGEHPPDGSGEQVTSGIDVCGDDSRDLISNLPDECLACIFQSLGSGDRKRCSVVCRRWLRVEGQSRNRLALDARSEIEVVIPSIFSRYDSVKRLALKCDRGSVSIGDDALDLISCLCRKLARLKLRACSEITAVGLAGLARNCRSLKKLSCASCAFGARGLNAFLEYASALEELSVKRLRGFAEGAATELIWPGAAAASLKIVCLKELYNGQCFEPLIVESKNLKSLKLFRCSGDWDRSLEAVVATRASRLREFHFERLQISDRGLHAISKCLDLEILHLVKVPDCTNAGLTSIAARCKLLRKLHIDGWKTNQIGDEGLISVARRCPNLQELVLIGVNPTLQSLGFLATNCTNLERLALCGSDTIGDAELSCIAAKCVALRKLCIKACAVSDQGIESLVDGCPNLVKVKVKKCRVTPEGAELLSSKRASLVVNFDTDAVEIQDASISDGGHRESDEEQYIPVVEQIAAAGLPSNSRGRCASSKAKLGLFKRNFVACCFWRKSLSNCEHDC